MVFYVTKYLMTIYDRFFGKASVGEMIPKFTFFIKWKNGWDQNHNQMSLGDEKAIETAIIS